MSGILWVIIVGFVAGIIARMLSPGPNNPGGFILTTQLVNNAFGGAKYMLTVINAGHWLAVILVMGLVIGWMGV